jgi:predicted  nucleic acid-binding Zn-ribbon protein
MSELLQPSFESVETLRLERDRALEEAAKWRRRYEVEAQQRRTETEAADRTIRDLRAEISQLCQMGKAVRPALSAMKHSPVSDSDSTLERLTFELAQLTQARNELEDALVQEQQHHAKTRENLISALGEALQRGKP